MNTIAQNNALIAEFMGAKEMTFDTGKIGHSFWHTELEGKVVFPNGATNYWKYSDEGYHKSWDWLMPVVEKIESIYMKPHGYFAVLIQSNGCTIQGTNFNSLKPELAVYYFDYYGDSKLKATYEAVVNFIEWYNEQKK